ncbi:MAG: rhodanese-like domain-containing protein [Alphaproteobacteria bacterium]|nr:rhodanese-like domain-containing protein [Alphaproteobacteria bacterium]
MLERGFKKLLAEANAVIDTVSVNEAAALISGDDAVLVDVRESREREKDGGITGSIHAARGFLEFHADPEHPMHLDSFASGKQLILYCATGGRSALAAKTLRDMGIANVCHMAGGISAWKEAGGAIG